jgi:hypothetical protein
VLLLAYRRNWLATFNPKSWNDVLAKARNTPYDKLKAPPGLKIQCLFWYDRTASETLSCALLDALVCQSTQRKKLRDAEKELRDAEKLSDKIESAHMKKKNAMNKLNAIWSKLIEQTKLTSSQKKNVQALCALFHEMYSPDKCHSNEANQNDEANQKAKAILDAEQQQMPSDAGIYLCWYSQLRDLIKREPRLAQELAVCALPGGGFTGDWFIGVVKGSVSLALGQQIIRMLCSQEEDYKRFTHGVGLPVSKSFYKPDKTKFYAWPHAMDVFLKDIKDIYDDAHSRAEILHYRKFHTALSVLARQLAPPDLSVKATDDEKKKAREGAVGIVERVFAQIQTLAPPDK